MKKRNDPLFDRALKPKPVIEVEEKNFKVRAVLLVVCIAVALVSLGFWVYSMFKVDPGWYTITANTSVPNCGSELTFSYHIGANGADAKKEKEAVTDLYTQLCQEAYGLFTWDVEQVQEGGIRYVSDNRNQAVTVDGRLYDALALAKDNRLLYMGPVTAEYAQMFQYTDQAIAAQYDPAQNPDLMAFITTLAGFVNDPEQVQLELLDNNQVRLYVSPAFLEFAAINGIEAFLDFGWLKNAFIVDYIADGLAAGGYDRGYLVSYDGYGRYLETPGTEFTLSVYDRLGQDIDRPAAITLSGPVSTVLLRNFPLNEADRWHYFAFDNGRVASVYVDPTDGVCKSATDNLLCYSRRESCAQMVLKAAPLFLTEELDEFALYELRKDDTFAVWAEGKQLRYTENGLKLAVIAESGYTAKLFDSPQQ